MVSYPPPVADGAAHVTQPSRWLANRRPVGQDASGRVIIGTTNDAFFFPDRLAHLPGDVPLGLTLALSLTAVPSRASPSRARVSG